MRYERPISKEGIKRICLSVWARIDQIYLAKLYDTITRRMKKVIEAKGGHTKY